MPVDVSLINLTKLNTAKKNKAKKSCQVASQIIHQRVNLYQACNEACTDSAGPLTPSQDKSLRPHPFPGRVRSERRRVA